MNFFYLIVGIQDTFTKTNRLYIQATELYIFKVEEIKISFKIQSTWSVEQSAVLEIAPAMVRTKRLSSPL